MPKALYAGYPSLPLAIAGKFTLEMCVTVKNRQKSRKNFILVFKVIQGHCFRYQSKASVELPITD